MASRATARPVLADDLCPLRNTALTQSQATASTRMELPGASDTSLLGRCQSLGAQRPNAGRISTW
jgi:hypothetical protein